MGAALAGAPCLGPGTLVEPCTPGDTSGWRAARREFKELLHLALPLSLTSLCSSAIGFVTSSFAGRLGEFELSVVVLATSIFNVTGLSLLVGCAAAMESLCGQAYGAGRHHMVGIVLQRAVLLTLLVVAVVGALWSQAGPLLRATGQDPEIAQAAGHYLQLVTPALLFTGFFEAMKRYLFAQSAVHPATAATLLGLAVSPLYNWLFIFRLGWGLDGAALAVVAVQCTMAAALAIYIAIRHRLQRGLPSRTWGGWSREALSGWGGYARVALPSVVMLCAEWWTFEAVIILSGLLPGPEVSVAVSGIAFYTSTVNYMCVSGLAMATSVRVSNSLGAGRPRGAQRSMRAAVLLTACLEGLVVAAAVAARRQIPRIFTDAQAVLDTAARLLPILALGLFGDGLNGCMQGLLRGAGKQGLGAVTNLCCYWLLGIPLAAYLAFRVQWGVFGLWWGLVAVNTLQGGVMLVTGWRLDFEGQADKAGRLFRRQGSAAITEPLLSEEGDDEGSLDVGQAAAQQHEHLGGLASSLLLRGEE